MLLYLSQMSAFYPHMPIKVSAWMGMMNTIWISITQGTSIGILFLGLAVAIYVFRWVVEIFL